MDFLPRNLKYLATACVAAVIGIAATNVIGQDINLEKAKADKAEQKLKSKGFCENNNWSNGDRVSATDLREITVASSGTVNVDAGKNGGISVKGEDRSDVLVRACVQAWAETDVAARSAVASVKINTSGEIKAEGPSGDNNWSVSYQILVPRATNTSLTARNGGISLSNVDGKAEFETTNGGVNLSNLVGNVKGRTANGGVNVSLIGTSWKGRGLDVQTTNGGVNLTLPADYAANIETGTVNGGYNSEIPALSITTEIVMGDEWGRSKSRRVNLDLNGGGAPIRVITTNGGVKINTPKQ